MRLGTTLDPALRDSFPEEVTDISAEMTRGRQPYPGAGANVPAEGSADAKAEEEGAVGSR